jgi:hypothetical protein
MGEQKVKIAILDKFADFWNGMATAWAFACYDAIIRGAIVDLLIALLLAILALVISIGITLHITYDKLS